MTVDRVKMVFTVDRVKNLNLRSCFFSVFTAREHKIEISQFIWNLNGVLNSLFISREPARTKRCRVEAYRQQVCDPDIGCFPSWRIGGTSGWWPSLAWGGPAWPGWPVGCCPFYAAEQGGSRVAWCLGGQGLGGLLVGGTSSSLSPGVAESHIRLKWWEKRLR